MAPRTRSAAKSAAPRCDNKNGQTQQNKNNKPKQSRQIKTKVAPAPAKKRVPEKKQESQIKRNNKKAAVKKRREKKTVAKKPLDEEPTNINVISNDHFNFCESDSEIDTIGNSSSSSSAEDSDDDYEQQIVKNKNRTTSSQLNSCSDESDDESQINELIEIEKKLDREVRKKRLFKKRCSNSKISDENGIICEFESSTVQKNRKRRVFRRQMLTSANENKRRRIRRTNVDVTDDYTYDSFADFGVTVDALTSRIESKDSSVNRRKLKKCFAELEIETDMSADEYSEEDEAELISLNLNFYASRNAKERVEQVARMNVNPFVDKLAEYNGRKAREGNSHSRIHTYHPDVLNGTNTYKLSEALVWHRPFTTLIPQETQFDENRAATEALNSISAERVAQKRREMLETIRKQVRERLINRKKLKPGKIMGGYTTTNYNHASTSDYIPPEEEEETPETQNFNSFDYEDMSGYTYYPFNDFA